MSIDKNAALALYKANLELWLRTGKLVQESRKKWLQLTDATLDEQILEADREIAQVLDIDDWQALLTKVSGEAWSRGLQQHFDDLQGLARTVADNHARFASGFQEALAAWQKESAQALAGMGSEAPVYSDFLKRLTEWGETLAAGAGVQEAAPKPEKGVRNAKPRRG